MGHDNPQQKQNRKRGSHMKPLFDDKKSDAVSDRLSTPSSSPVVMPPAADTTHPITLDEIDQLGAAQGTRIAAFSQQMLATVRASDADRFGDKLSELIATAKGLDPRDAERRLPASRIARRDRRADLRTADHAGILRLGAREVSAGPHSLLFFKPSHIPSC